MDKKLKAAIRRAGLNQGHFMCNVDEYNTSQVCPKWLGFRTVIKTKYLKRQPRSKRQSQRLDASGRQTGLRVRVCPACRMVYHRDGLAAQNISTIAEATMKSQDVPGQLRGTSSHKEFSTKKLSYDKETQEWFDVRDCSYEEKAQHLQVPSRTKTKRSRTQWWIKTSTLVMTPWAALMGVRQGISLTYLITVYWFML